MVQAYTTITSNRALMRLVIRTRIEYNLLHVGPASEAPIEDDRPLLTINIDSEEGRLIRARNIISGATTIPIKEGLLHRTTAIASDDDHLIRAAGSTTSQTNDAHLLHVDDTMYTRIFEDPVTTTRIPGEIEINNMVLNRNTKIGMQVSELWLSGAKIWTRMPLMDTRETKLNTTKTRRFTTGSVQRMKWMSNDIG